MSSCRRIVERLASYVDNALPAVERAEVDRHLERCPPCRDAAAAERAGHTIVRRAAERLRSVPVPETLRGRCEALARQHAAASRTRAGGRLGQAVIAALLVLLAVWAIVSLATPHSEVLLAAQLTADHSSCFRLFAPSGSEGADARQIERMLAERHGWEMHVPPTSAAAGVQLIGARRCLYADGRVAHIMYRANGQDVSLYRLEGVTREEAQVDALGHRSLIWSRDGDTYVLVLPEGAGGMTRAVEYVMREAR